MAGTELFTVIFMAVMLIGLPLMVFLEYGGMDAIVDKIIKLVDSYNNKKKDI